MVSTANASATGATYTLFAQTDTNEARFPGIHAGNE